MSLYSLPLVLQVWTQLLPHILITTYYFWKNPNLLNWKPAVQWPLPLRCVFSNWHQNVYLMLKMGHPRPLFCLFLSFQTNIIFATYICEKMSIQYTVQGFKPTIFRTWVSSHNHYTRDPTPLTYLFVAKSRPVIFEDELLLLLVANIWLGEISYSLKIRFWRFRF